MKALILPTIILIFITSIIKTPTSFAQEDQDPFVGNYILGNSAELYMMFSKGSGPPEAWKYDFNSDVSSITSEQIRVPEYYDNKNFDVCTGDFNGDGYDDVVEAKIKPTGTTVPHLFLHVSDKWEPFDAGIPMDPTIFSPNIRLVTGDFDSDSEKEFVLAYKNADGSIHIDLYGIDSNKTIYRETSETWQLDPLQFMLLPFDIATGDFDADGTDEIVIVKSNSLIANADSAYVAHIDLSVRIYDYDPNSNILSPEATKDIKRTHIYEWYPVLLPHTDVQKLMKLSIATGNLRGDNRDEFIVGYSLQKDYYTPGGVLEFVSRHLAPYMLSFEMRGLPGQFNIFDALANSDPPYWEKPVVKPEIVLEQMMDDPDSWTEFPFTILCEDLNMDGWDEIICSGNDTVDVFSVEKDLDLFTGGRIWDETGKVSIPINPVKWSYGLRRQFDVADLNVDTSDVIAPSETNWFPELLVVDCSLPWRQQVYSSNSELEMQLTAYTVELNFQKESFNLNSSVQTTITGMKATSNYSMSAADFDGDGLRLGKPNSIIINDVVQPLVVLNSPPVHFDVINDTIYDINSAFPWDQNNSNLGMFYSEYAQEQTNSYTVTTEFNRDWGLSSSLTGKFIVAGNGIKSTLEGHYGNGFSKIDDTTETTTIQSKTRAELDDRIYYSVVDYHLLEYPVYYKNDFLGNILVANPKKIKNLKWESIQYDWDNYSFISNHEIGNIFSYNPPQKNFNISPIDNSYFELDEYTLGTTGFHSGSVKYQQYINGLITSSHEFGFSADLLLKIGFEGKISVKPFGIGVGYGVDIGLESRTSGFYDQKQITTTKTSVSSSWELLYNLETVNELESRYSIKPYVYKSYNGVLTLDFSAEPAPNAEWWQNTYGEKPDLTFIQPLRYYPEMGYNSSIFDEYKRFRTNDIFIKPLSPALGDTVEIITRIHNFSLANISLNDTVKIHYYLGDPDYGGKQITDLLKEGYSQSPNYNIKEPRSETFYYARWIVPNDVSIDERLYVVIDPDNTIDEIHESNNKGYIYLNPDKTTSIKNIVSQNIPNQYSLSQNYPNPFNPTTTINYQIKQRSKVTLIVYNLLGQKVKELENGVKDGGSYTVNFNASELSSGVYIFRLKAGKFSDVKKMLVLK